MSIGADHESNPGRGMIPVRHQDHSLQREAIAEFQALISMKPDYCVAYLHMGSSLLEADRPEDAIEVLEQARQLAIDQSHTAPRQEAEMLLEQAREELE